jgi:hypothetical protein
MRVKFPPLQPYTIDNKWLYVPIAKNAHRSVVQAIKMSGATWKKECWNVLPNIPRVVLLREPMDRLYSAYRMFVADKTIHDVTFESFVSQLLSGKPVKSVPLDDMHLQTQWAAMGEREPEILVKWNMGQLASILGLGIIPHVGKSKAIEWKPLSGPTQRLFDDYYRKDVELWNDGNKNGNP